jgi:hypothetical protein
LRRVEVPASLDTVAGIQNFVALVARGITGAIDVGRTLLDANTLGKLSMVTTKAYRPQARDPISADLIADTVGRLVRYTRPVRSEAKMVELFGEAGVKLRLRMAVQEVRDAEAIAAGAMSDGRGQIETGWKSDAAKEESLRVARGIIEAAGGMAAGRVEPSSWERLCSNDASLTDEEERTARDALVTGVASWLQNQMPLPLATRMLRRIQHDALHMVSAAVIEEIESFGRMLATAGAWAQSSRCGAGISADVSGKIASVAMIGIELSSSATMALEAMRV